MFLLHLFYLFLSSLIMPKSKTYSSKDTENAFRDIKEKYISISQAAKEYNIPKKTFADRKKTKNPEQENSLKNYIFYMASYAFPVNINQIKDFAWAILLRRGCEK